MLKLIVLSDKPIFNDDVTVKKITETFYCNGYAFDSVITVRNEYCKNVMSDIENERDNLFVIFRSPAKFNFDNAWAISELDLDGSCNYVIKELEKVFGQTYGKCIFRVFGADKSVLKNALLETDKLRRDNSIEINIQSDCGDTKIELIYNNVTPKMAVDTVIRIFAEQLNEWIYAEDDVSLPLQLNRLLKLRCKSVSTCESFTCGRIASSIISIPGASSIFNEGIVAYSNLAKETRLGVSRETLYRFGAVSAECCSEMVQGLLDTNKCDVAIASTGIAGPASDDKKKPVGLCYLGIGTQNGIDVFKYNFSGTRETITQTAVNAALFNAIKCLKYM